jgi:hypothetical protein
VPETADHAEARVLAATVAAAIRTLAPLFPHDAAYLAASVVDVERWADDGFGVPDFLDSSSPSSRRSTASTACATSSSSRCTRRTARATASSRRCSAR